MTAGKTCCRIEGTQMDFWYEIFLKEKDLLGHSSKHQIDDAHDEPAVDHDIFPPAKLTLFGRMEKTLSLLKDSLGSVFLAQFWVPEVHAGQYVLTTLHKPYLCFPHSTLEAYRQPSLICAQFEPGFRLDLPGRVFACKVPEWTSNVVYYSQNEYLQLRRPFDISQVVRGIIAFPVFDSDDRSCCAVLELLTVEEKPDFDSEVEKVFKALKAVNLRSNASPRLRPECFSSDQRAVLAEITDVIRAACQTHRLPLALTWIPCYYTEEAVDEISKLHVSIGDSRLSGKCVLCIERTACYVDEEMQGFVHACEQRYIEEGQGIAGKALPPNVSFFVSNVKAFDVTDYPLVHHSRKYGLSAAVAIRLRSIYAGGNDYILEFFLPVNIEDRSQQQLLLDNLSVTLQELCKSLRIVSDTELVSEQGSKVGLEEGARSRIPAMSMPGRSQTTLFKGDLNSIDGVPPHVSSLKSVDLDKDGPHEQEVREQKPKIEPVPNDDGKMFIICANNKRRKTSEVWKSFNKVKGENGAVWAVCKGCNEKYPGESKKGISNLLKHLKSCSKKRQQDAQQHSSPSDLRKNFAFDQAKSRLNLAKMIMKLGCPLRMVKQEAFKTFVHGLQPKFEPGSQDTVETDVLVVYREEKKKLIKYFHNLSCLFSLTVDLQPYSDKEVHCCFTLHFIDERWDLKKMIIAFRNLGDNYDAGTLRGAIKSVLKEWSIDKNCNLMFAEFSPPNGQMARDLEHKLFNEVSCRNGDVFCVSSYEQILDLLVRDGFYEIQSVLHKIRETIKYVNGAPDKRLKFREAINQMKLQYKKIVSRDDPTRWDTTFLMLKRALHFRTAFTHLEQVDIDFKVNPSANEWKMAMDVCQCLKVFYKSLCSSSSSIDVYFLNVCYIYKNLLQWERSEHVHICSMAKRMKMILDKYWNECGLALGIVLVLDPRFKLEFLLYGYGQIYGSDANLHLLKFINSFACIYNKYANDTNHLESSSTKSSGVNCLTLYHPNSGDKLLGFCEWLKQKHDSNMVDTPKSDLDRYIEEPLESLDNVQDILAWWRVNAPKYPVLGKMAPDFLAIHVSKSIFSNEARKMNPGFNGLRPEVVEALICGQDWLESFERNSKEGKPGSSLILSNVRCDSPVKQMNKYLAGPFTVSKPISPGDLELIQYIFDLSLIGSEIVVQCKNYYLTRRELCSLRPQTCLDDNILSTMSDAITLVERKKQDYVNWYLPICFMEYAYDPLECTSFAKKHRIKENYMPDLFPCEKMFVPVFDKERSHFYLYVLHLKKQVVEIWDSLAESSDSNFVNQRLHNLLVSLDTLFKDDIVRKNYQNGWSFADFRVERPMNVPQQPNGYDCGVYVIKFMLQGEEVTNPDFVFDSDKERLEVVLRLLAGDVNSCRNELASKAGTYYEQRFGNHRVLENLW